MSISKKMSLPESWVERERERRNRVKLTDTESNNLRVDKEGERVMEKERIQVVPVIAKCSPSPSLF